MSAEKAELGTLEVTELLAKGAIVEIFLSAEGFVSQVFLVEKKDGGHRPVINLKGLDQFVRAEHFKMPTHHSRAFCKQENGW